MASLLSGRVQRVPPRSDFFVFVVCCLLFVFVLNGIKCPLLLIPQRHFLYHLGVVWFGGEGGGGFGVGVTAHPRVFGGLSPMRRHCLRVVVLPAPDLFSVDREQTLLSQSGQLQSIARNVRLHGT